MRKNFVVIDYGTGNVRSIINAFKKKGKHAKLSREKHDILQADGVVLPGVGAFSHGMGNLNKYGLTNIIKEYVLLGKPCLGICLGMQLMFEESDEFGVTKGLGLIEGRVVRLPVQDPNNEKLPHVSWNEIQRPEYVSWDGTILDGVNSNQDMYFVHSYVAMPTNKENVLSISSYSKYSFVSSVRKNSIYGCQFHPENSANEGLNIIDNFIKICDQHDD